MNNSNNFKKFLFIFMFLLFLLNLFIIENETSILASSSDLTGNTEVNMDNVEKNNFTNVHYIENYNYFKTNPKHMENPDPNDSYLGTCTTIAAQLLLGYHNYYSDRRLIPSVDLNGNRFLNEDYGILEKDPYINYENSISGNKYIGTEDALYQELLLLNDNNDSLFGQTTKNIADVMKKFINKFSIECKADVDISANSYLQANDTVKAEILNDLNNEKPIILGFSFMNSGTNTFHVVVAYGYATLNGTDGFICHYGWGADRTQIWIPASWFRYTIKMNVNHVHNYDHSEFVLKNAYLKSTCSLCGVSKVETIFNISENKSSITGLKYPVNGELIIPRSIENNEITEISEKAFSGNNDLSKIVLPRNLVKIGSKAFENCINLQDITFYNTVTSIGESAFKNCKKLSSIIIPNNVKKIENSTFENCISLRSVIFSSEATDIGDYAFKNCQNLVNIYFSNYISKIGISSFEGCTNLVDLYLPNLLSTIGESSFKDCINLVLLSLPESVGVIGKNSFKNCNKLERVIINNSEVVVDLGLDAFDNCTNLSVIKVKENIIELYKNSINWQFFCDIICIYDCGHAFELNPNLIDTKNHTYVCNCGATITEGHDYNSNYICADCNYHHHHVLKYTSLYDNKIGVCHKEYCTMCNYVLLEAHDCSNGTCKCGFNEQHIQLAWQGNQLVSKETSIFLPNDIQQGQIIKLYTQDFGVFYLNNGYNSILLYGTGEVGTPFAKVDISVNISSNIIYFGMILLGEGPEYPDFYYWQESSFKLIKVELVG